MTPHARAHLVVLLGALSGALVVLAPGCSLDWQVRPDPADAALGESSLADVTIADTGLDVLDAGNDSEPDADPCVALGADLARARAKAKECQFGTAGQCKATVQDECKCDVIVRAGGSSEDTAYANAIAAFLAASCAPMPACGACPQLGNMVSWTCVSTGTCLP